MKISTILVSASLWATTMAAATNVLFFQQACWRNSTTEVGVSRQSQKQIETTPVSLTEVEWTPSIFQGLEIGKSSYGDVKRLFGKPRWEGANEEATFEQDPESEILLQYSREKDGIGGMDVIVGDKTKIVKAVSFTPYPGLTRQEAISKYGSEYFEISSGESMCIKDNSKRGDSVKNLNYPVLLVYPEKGMYLSINEDATVNHIGFLYKCVE